MPVSDDLERLAQLHTAGQLDDEEFRRAKTRLLADEDGAATTPTVAASTNTQEPGAEGESWRVVAASRAPQGREVQAPTPHVKRSQKSGVTTAGWVVIWIIVAVALVSWIDDWSWPTGGSSTGSADRGRASSEGQVDEPVRVGDLSVTVVEQPECFDVIGRSCMVTYNVTNEGHEQVRADSDDFLLLDAEGRRYSVTEDSFYDSLNPGVTKWAVVSYDIPANVVPVAVLIDFKGQQARITVTPEVNTR